MAAGRDLSWVPDAESLPFSILGEDGRDEALLFVTVTDPSSEGADVAFRFERLVSASDSLLLNWELEVGSAWGMGPGSGSDGSGRIGAGRGNALMAAIGKEDRRRPLRASGNLS